MGRSSQCLLMLLELLQAVLKFSSWSFRSEAWIIVFDMQSALLLSAVGLFWSLSNQSLGSLGVSLLARAAGPMRKFPSWSGPWWSFISIFANQMVLKSIHCFWHTVCFVVVYSRIILIPKQPIFGKSGPEVVGWDCEYDKEVSFLVMGMVVLFQHFYRWDGFKANVWFYKASFVFFVWENS